MATNKKPEEVEVEEVEEVETKKPVAKAKVKKEEPNKKEKFRVRVKRKVKENKKPIIAGAVGFLSGAAATVLGSIGYSKWQSKRSKPITREDNPLDPNL